MPFVKFLRSDAGAVTIDWTVLLAALTGMGLALLNVVGGALGDHSREMRGELQDPHFDTEWLDYVAVQPQPAQ
jgi:hypothetical protein